MKRSENSPPSTWLSDELNTEERAAAKTRAGIAVTVQTERKALGLTQEEFARKLGVSQAMVSRWENGEENYTIQTLAKLSSSLGIDLRNPLVPSIEA